MIQIGNTSKKKTVKNLEERCRQLDIKEIAIPRIGSGLDNLNWEKIMKVLKSIFENSPTKVRVLYLDEKNEEAFTKVVRNKRFRKKMKPRTNRLEIVGDSHVKNLGPILSAASSDNLETYALAYPGATTGKITKDFNLITSHLTPEDNLLIMTGTNDIKEDDKSVVLNMHMDDRSNMLSQAKHTNVTMVLVPFRYDKEELNEYIHTYNQSLITLCEEEQKKVPKGRISILDPNKVLARMHYTSQGLHLNPRGKQVLCNKILQCVEERIGKKEQVFD